MDDLISRQAAIDAIVNTVSEVGLHDNSEVARYGATFRQHEIINIIEGLPAAQPERKRGKWIRHKDRACWYCSECTADDYYAYIRDCDSGEYELQDNFCPNCGADMKGEEE